MVEMNIKLAISIMEDAEGIWSVHLFGPDARSIQTEINIPEDYLQDYVRAMTPRMIEIIPILRKARDEHRKRIDDSGDTD